MITIKAPNKAYSGEVAGVTFVRGEAKVDELEPHIKDWFKRRGYEVIEAKQEAKKAKK